jgi:hypothetical protein
MCIFYYLSKKCKKIFKNLLLNLPFFIFCKIKFFENLVFLTDTVADLAYTLCAHCHINVHHIPYLPIHFGCCMILGASHVSTALKGLCHEMNIFLKAYQ